MIPESLRLAPAVYKSIALAAKYHDGQTRKEPIFLEGNERGAQSFLPYVTHPLEVMKTVWTWGAGNTVTLCAAACHDLLEDTNCPPEEIAALHPEVLQVVQELTCTVPADVDPQEKKRIKEAYMESFKDASLYALVIKAADRICNVKDFKRTNPGYAKKYLLKANAVFAAVESRWKEVNERFGLDCYNQIINEQRSLL